VFAYPDLNAYEREESEDAADPEYARVAGAMPFVDGTLAYEIYRGEVARRWRYRDGSGEIGVIASVTQPFCGDCTRARLSAEGRLYTCLFGLRGHDLRALVRGQASDEELAAEIGRVWSRRIDRYSEIRSANTSDLPKVEMSYIGG
jgi:cyclic pyranopterin phosphate synthase